MTLCPADLLLPPRFSRYRAGQLTTALDVVASDKRWSLIQATTGSGKSLLNQTVSRLLNMRTLTTTPSKALQRQYTGDFPYLALIEGSDNYRCADTHRMGRRTCAADNDGSANCRYRRRMRDGEPVNTNCPYLAAQQVARDSFDVVSNTAYWLALGRYNPNAIGKYGLLVCDEAHNLLNVLTDTCALEFTAGELRAIHVDAPPVGAVDMEWGAWALGAVDAAVTAYRRARDHGATAQQLETLTELGKRLRELSNTATGGTSDVAWVGEAVRGGWRWCPVWPGARFAETKLWRGVPHVVLSSATLTHEDAKHLGLARDDYSFHELDAGFDPRRRPLYYLPTARIDKNLGDGEWRMVVNEYDRFIGPRLKLGWRGVVQATSYEWAQRVLSTSRYADQMVTHGRGNSREVVAQFVRRNGPGVLVSPTVSEGHDFIGDIARWQVHVKLPYPNTMSPVIKARCDSDKNYRYHLAGRSLEQRCGRTMRKHDDWGENLLCDSHFGYMRAKPVFTKSFRDTWRTVDSTPVPLEL